jgi:hypothetical protein
MLVQTVDRNGHWVRKDHPTLLTAPDLTFDAEVFPVSDAASTTEMLCWWDLADGTLLRDPFIHVFSIHEEL